MGNLLGWRRHPSARDLKEDPAEMTADAQEGGLAEGRLPAGVGLEGPHLPKYDVDEIVATYKSRRPKAAKEKIGLITDAFSVAFEAHKGQLRHSGEPFISHPLSVASIVSRLGLDEVSIAAALLHDTVEDTHVSLEEIQGSFGVEVAKLVDSLTKLDRLNFDSREAQQAATMRKMLIAMATDWRVLVIKLADRLHNMETIGALPQWKQQRIARETLDIYAPLAHRLGVQELKWRLEDRAFEALHPGPYKEISELVERRAPERETYLSKVIEVAEKQMDISGIAAEITGRPKHYWSIYEKMVVKGKEFDDIYDLVGIRVILGDERDCWAAMGTIHSLWTPVQGRFKDYINSPKFNLYQSLHTTVVGPEGKALEVQIRTREMHRRAEFGVAAHWGYKENSTPAEIAWLQRIMDWQADTPDPLEFLETLKLDLEQDEVYVFTPKGKVVTLPASSTPIDFAYAIHTDVGHRCIGARVNDRLVPLDRKLASGETVEIVTTKASNAGPSRDWLKVVATPRARNKIRQWFSKERRDDAIETGREELVKSLRREGLPTQKLMASEALVEVASALHFEALEALFVAIGEGHLSARSVIQRLSKELTGGSGGERLPTTATQSRRRPSNSAVGVYVEGLDDMMIRLSKCCTPVPGDQIIGFVTRGRGVSVHRVDCANAIALLASSQERMIEVEWDRERHGVFIASIEVKALDRSALLTDVSRVLSEHHLNIISSSTHTGSDRVSRMSFDVELADPDHLDSVLTSLRQLDCVYDVYRMLPGAKSAAGKHTALHAN